MSRPPGPELETFLRSRSSIEIVEVIIGEEIAPRPGRPLALVLGGDGAILRACRGFGPPADADRGNQPGSALFLADLSPDEFRNQIQRLRVTTTQVVHHLMLECEHRRADGTSKKYLGLNEAAIH